VKKQTRRAAVRMTREKEGASKVDTLTLRKDASDNSVFRTKSYFEKRARRQRGSSGKTPAISPSASIVARDVACEVRNEGRRKKYPFGGEDSLKLSM